MPTLSLSEQTLGRSEQTLSRSEQDILAFESRWTKHTPMKERAIVSALGMSAARYYQLLHRIVQRPAAIKDDPFLTARVRSQTRSRH